MKTAAPRIVILLATSLGLAASIDAATILVTAVDDLVADDGLCTFREAIEAAESNTSSGASPGECAAGSGADIIQFDLPEGSFIETVTSASYVVTESLTISGPGAEHLTIGGNGLVRVFHVGDGAAPGSLFEFSGFTLTGGNARWTGGSLTEGHGGGIYKISGELVLRDMVFSTNHADVRGGALMAHVGSPVLIERCAFLDNTTTTFASQVAAGGGAVSLSGGIEDTPVTIRDSLFARNHASGDTDPFTLGESGGALHMETGRMVVLIERSTFSGNTAAGEGGAIHIAGGLINVNLTFDMVDSTVTGNTADSDANSTMASGGGIAEEGNLQVATITNSVIAGNVDLSPVANPAPDLLLGASAVSGGTNVVGVDVGAAIAFPAGDPNVNGDQVGTAAAPLDPHLAPLADNGGSTESHLPEVVAASPLVDQGDCPGALHDQRGFANLATGLRAVDIPAAPNTSDACDVGAVEANADPPAAIFSDGFESSDTSAWSSTVGGP